MSGIEYGYIGNDEDLNLQFNALGLLKKYFEIRFFFQLQYWTLIHNDSPHQSRKFDIHL
jgi:hypothetical protein